MHVETRELTKIYLELKHLRREFALRDVSIQLRPGEIVAVLGSNGAGKTTLLKSLMGLVIPSSGEIIMDGQAFSRQRLDFRKRIGYLADVPLLRHGESLTTHVSRVVACYEKRPDGVAEQIAEWVHELGLSLDSLRPFQLLSRGQQYKAAMVALLAVDPELWIVDEPFASGMDPNGLAFFRHHVLNAARRGSTVVYSTQILEVAERFADRICILKDGRLLAFDSMSHLRERYGSRDADLQVIYDLLSDA